MATPARVFLRQVVPQPTIHQQLPAYCTSVKPQAEHRTTRIAAYLSRFSDSPMIQAHDDQEKCNRKRERSHREMSQTKSPVEHWLALPQSQTIWAIQILGLHRV